MKVDEVLKGLKDEELYSDLCVLYEMNACSAKGIPKQTKCSIHRMAGEAYFHQQRYSLSLAVRFFNAFKNLNIFDLGDELPRDVFSP